MPKSYIPASNQASNMPMNTPTIETERLLLRKFTEDDIEALFLLLSDKEVNTFLPWFPVQNISQAAEFYTSRIYSEYKCGHSSFYAICPKNHPYPVGYLKAETGDGHDFGYALRREFWGRGLVTEAGRAVIEILKQYHVPYITATHDVNNPRSGAVMRRLGMTYQYSYVELWQPKNYPVTFRLYQLNLDGSIGRTYRKYWNLYPEHFIENSLAFEKT